MTDTVSTKAAAGTLLAPVQGGERIQVLDLLRGFALLGILLVNARFFAYPMQDIMTGFLGTPEGGDYAAAWFVAFAAQGKFYSLFSFLFGLGFTVILERAAAKGVSGARLFVRRTLILLGIGLVHGILIWPGDILTMYAMSAFLLLLLRNLKPRTTLIVAIVLLALPVVFMGLFTGLMALGGMTPEGAAEMARQQVEQAEQMRALREAAFAAYSTGGFVAVTQQRMSDFFTMLMYFPMWMPGVLGMFLIGAYFGKRKLLHEADAHLPLFRRLLWTGLLVGVPLSAYWATTGIGLNMSWPSGEVFLAMLANGIAAPLMCLMYVSLFVLFVRRWAPAPLASLGRMALTNYLLQSLVWSTVFYGYGLGLFGKPQELVLLGAAVGFWLLQLPLSHWWLGRFRFGPAEWLWRSLTYGRRQPMRRGPLQSANSAA